MVIFDPQWKLPFPTSLKPLFEPTSTIKDKVLWAVSPTSTFSAATTWDAIRTHGPIVHSHKLVQFPTCIYTHSFIPRMAAEKKLRIEDKLSNWGVIPSSLALCRQELHTASYIISGCTYSRNIRKHVCHLGGTSKEQHIGMLRFHALWG